MNKVIIGQLARQSVHGLEKQAIFGRLMGRVWGAGANAGQRAGQRLTNFARNLRPGKPVPPLNAGDPVKPSRLATAGKYIGGLATTMAAAALPVAGVSGITSLAYPDYAKQYAKSMEYKKRMEEAIDNFRRGRPGSYDPSRSALSRFFGSDIHYSDAERSARANELMAQLKAGTLKDSGYYKDRMNTAVESLRNTPLQGGGFRGLLPGGFASWPGLSGLENAKQHHQKFLGEYGWTPDKRQLRDWSGATNGNLPAMGGVNYPMPLGLSPSLYAPDHISQHYRPQLLASAEFTGRR